MSVLSRTLVSIPAAALGALLLVATSQMEWGRFAEGSTAVVVELDDDGVLDGELAVTVAGLPALDERWGWELRVSIQSDDVRKSLDVVDPQDGRVVQVRDGMTLQPSLDEDCPEAGTCELTVPVRFEGRPNRVDTVYVLAELGSWDRIEPTGKVVPTVEVEWLD